MARVAWAAEALEVDEFVVSPVVIAMVDDFALPRAAFARARGLEPLRPFVMGLAASLRTSVVVLVSANFRVG
jgi:hypothetical protein